MTPLKLITPPAVAPLTLAETKEYLRVDHSDEDDVIARLDRRGDRLCGRSRRLSATGTD